MSEVKRPGGDPTVPLAVDPGLCGGCRWAEVVRSRRAAYLRCGRSDGDPSFPRYPPLPVRVCRGYQRFDTPPADGPEPAAGTRRGGGPPSRR
ncbi:MAG: hypothetical protein DWQ36_01385 [Acidobacteria bacterium]|nr:MAG: hypothetical protein DWQ30_14175 [Acidobacteriota bacterium]REK11664.1 MAG: hypothetical protein DWQ36_01385 [Acidobacteriota bacterium]